MQRVSLGLIALSLLLVGTITLTQHPQEGKAFASVCIRTGLVLGALWLALPQVTRFWRQTPKWLLIAAGMALVVVVIHPMYALAAVPLLAALWFFGPKLTAIWKPKSGTTTATARRQPETPAAQTSVVSAPPAKAPPRPRRRSNAR